MKKYAVGFMFNSNKSKIALVTKARPDWQKGKLNGVGGHVEGSESFRQAMVREFKEETGINTLESNWELMVELTKMGEFTIYFFKMVSAFEYDFTSQPDEPVNWYSVDDISCNVVYNLRYILPMFEDSFLQFPVLLYNR
jgi:8-oxo-dGTP diphosphatase